MLIVKVLNEQLSISTLAELHLMNLENVLFWRGVGE